MPGWPLIRPGIVLVLRAGTGRHHLNSPATEAALFSSSDVCRHVKPQRGSSPNAPHQYLDNHGYPSRALCYYSVPDARKRDFAYLCQRSFRPGMSTLKLRVFFQELACLQRYVRFADAHAADSETAALLSFYFLPIH